MSHESPHSQDISGRPFCFAGWLADPTTCRLKRGTQETRVEPKVMQVLVHLAVQAGQVVSRRELEASIWPKQVVGDDAVTNAIIKLRKALGDNARHPRIIETIPKRGYRLLGEVTPVKPGASGDGILGTNDIEGTPAPLRTGAQRATANSVGVTGHYPLSAITLGALIAVVLGTVAWWQPWSPQAEPAESARMSYPLPDKPSIAVLPFENLSPKGSDSYLADAITETLIATLGRVPELFIIARNSVFTYKGQAVDVRQVSRELGVRHVLEGSLQQMEDNIRVTAQLIDATTGEHLWAERYDRPLDDFFALQDDIALRVLVSLQGKLTEGADAALRSSSTKNVQAYLWFQQALSEYFKFTKDAMIETRRLADLALELDPQFATPGILKGWAHYVDARMGHSKFPEASLAAAEDELVGLEDFNYEPTISATIEGEASMLRAFIAVLRQQHDLALELARKTVTLIPNQADMLASYGLILHRAGHQEQAIETLKRAMRMNPKSESWQAKHLSLALTLSGKYEAAVVAAEDAINRAESQFNRAHGHMALAVAHADRGVLDSARREAKRGRELASYMTLGWLRSRDKKLYRNNQDWDRIEDALRAAGIPE